SLPTSRPREKRFRIQLSVARIYWGEGMTITRALIAPSAQLTHPALDGPPDLVRRIFLDVMDPRDSYFGLRWQPAGEIEIRAAGEERTGLGLHEQLGHTARRKPFRVRGHYSSNVGGLPLDGDLPNPRQRRASRLARFCERPSVLGHL